MKITHLINLNDSQQLSRLVWLALAALLIVIVAFGGYYYWDRYVYLNDESLLDMGVASLEEMVRENPEDPDARTALAQYYLENGAYPKAIEQAQQVLKSYPDNDDALFIQGMAFVQSGQTEAAVAPLEKFTAMRREAPMAGADTILETALYFLGASYVQMDQPTEAVTVLAEALTINRADADAMYQLGLAYAMNDQHELAMEQFQNAVRFVPDFAEAYDGMETSYAALGMTHHVAYARGMSAFSQRDYEAAYADLESAAANLSDFAPVYLGLGLALEQLGDLPAAQSNLEHVLALDPDNFMANNAYGRIQLLLSENE